MITAKVGSAMAVLALLLIVSSLAVSPISAEIKTSAKTDDKEDMLQYEWPQFMGDSSFTRYSPGPAPEAPDVLWKTNITGIQSYLAAFDGKVFACTLNAVYALDRQTGGILWFTVIPQPGPWPAVYKIDDSHMVVGSSCLDPDTGRIIWTSPVFSASPERLFSDSVYSPEEKLFYTKVNSYVQAWDFSNPSRLPTQVWATYVPGGGIVGSGVQYGDGKVFPGSYEAHQMALDARTGAVLWTTNTKAAMLFQGAYYDGKFFRGGTHDNTLYAFDADTGKTLWTFSPGTEGGYFCSGPAAAYGMVFELNKDGYLYALDANTGTVVWKYKGPGTLIFPGNPTVADGKIYATTGQDVSYGEEYGESEFACLDAYTGTALWRLPIEAFAPRESVAVAYGNLYLIPSNVTAAVDTSSGNEYSTNNQVWAIGTQPWGMWRHDAAHTGAGQSGPQNLTLRWRFTTDGAVVSSPSVADEIAYFGSKDKNIYAVNARDGTLIWKFTTGAGVLSSPAVVKGKVYTGTDDGYVYCLNAYDGSLLWKAAAGAVNVPAVFAASVELRSSPTVAAAMVYVGGLDNKTYCIGADNGLVYWSFDTGGYVTSSPAVADGAVYVVAQTPGSATLYKLTSGNGTLIWRVPIPYEITFMGGTDMHASPTVGDGMVFAASNTGAYYGIDAYTGNVTWTFKDPSATEFILCTPIYRDGKLFIVDKFSIVSLEAETGHKVWESYMGDELYISPSYADNKLYVVTDQRSIFVLNASDGQKLSRFVTDSNSWSAATVYEGRIYVGNNDWNVYCLADYPVLTSSLRVTLNRNQANSGENVTGFGQLTPGISNATITLTISNPKTAITRQVTTSKNGSFTFTFT
ncbi:MAG: PQQ-binding-like beta-propeller repeat protein, partial [Candidatus Bathyarchaeia archaeon]